MPIGRWERCLVYHVLVLSMEELWVHSVFFSKPVQKANFSELPVKRIKFCIDDGDSEIDSIQKLLKENKVAFIISEVIQGAGGCNVASKQFIRNLEKFAKQYEVPLILD